MAGGGDKERPSPPKATTNVGTGELPFPRNAEQRAQLAIVEVTNFFKPVPEVPSQLMHICEGNSGIEMDEPVGERPVLAGDSGQRTTADNKALHGEGWLAESTDQLVFAKCADTLEPTTWRVVVINAARQVLDVPDDQPQIHRTDVAAGWCDAPRTRSFLDDLPCRSGEECCYVLEVRTATRRRQGTR